MSGTNQTSILLEKLDLLMRRQEMFSQEIALLREEIDSLQSGETKELQADEPGVAAMAVNPPEQHNNPGTSPQFYDINRESLSKNKVPGILPGKSASLAIRSNIEKFIGENLINKIGIIITVIGVGIGAKYSIDHQLISPATRIILGYLMGLVLLAFGLKLKKSYLNYSAVLVSGAAAILYFITYASYSFYDLLPQLAAFLLMFIFTVFTVWAALFYDRQVIAYIGAVGAYAVPFLLSNGEGKITVLFSYIAIINIGIVGIALKKYWKPLYYSAFILTWVIYISWYATSYLPAEHYYIAFIFAGIFFLIFYTIVVGYKLLQQHPFELVDIMLLLSNAFVFYAVGYAILSSDLTGERLSGLFTLANAALHFCVSVIIYKRKGGDTNLFYLVGGLALIFITITIPVQLNGNWVTLLWSCEAALLFWIGRTKSVAFYAILFYPLMLLAFFSLVQDWSEFYSFGESEKPGNTVMPLFNIHFLTSLLVIISFSIINYIAAHKKYAGPALPKNVRIIVQTAVPGILLIVCYFSFQLEISHYWNQVWVEVNGTQRSNIFSKLLFEDSVFFKLKSTWVINYSLLFFAALGLVNNKRIKSLNLGWVTLFFSAALALLFLVQELGVLNQLRESYFSKNTAPYSNRLLVVIRYVSFIFFGGILTSIYQFSRADFTTAFQQKLTALTDIFLHICFIWIISSELVTWMDTFHFSQSDKLTISIVWGIYALLLIVRGIWKKKKHLRVGAIVLLLITLIKLFVYDISGLDNITKTIVFVSLGFLLLIISFLYNKYGVHIEEESE